MRASIFVSSSFVVLAACSCGGDEKKTIAALALDATEATLAPFESKAFHAIATFEDQTTEDVTASVEWTTSSDMVAAIGTSGAGAGVVLAISKGTAKITATIEGKTAEASIDVPDVELVAIHVDPLEADVVLGNTRQLFAIATYSDGTERDVAADATWTSTEETVATVVGGLVTPVAPGSTTIRAKFAGRRGSAEIYVSLNQVDTSPSNGEINVAVSRETVLRFLAPLAPSVVPSANDVHADIAGEALPARLHLSRDRRTLTLFYLSYLPASARVVVTIEGDALVDEHQRPLDADGDGMSGGTKQISFETLSLTQVPGTAVTGRVFASEVAAMPGGETVNVPLADVTITVEGIDPTQLSATTDAMGNFRLEPAPAGRFFALIEGRGANAGGNGAYYPHVSKAWVGVPGEVTTIGEVYLPRIPSGTLQLTSATAETVVEFPAEVLSARPDLQGVSVRVPAGALYADDGTIGGAVGIAPVPPDRLPGPLPTALRFPLVITVQTDGALNFDVPVPVCFPNLPDPTTGVANRPGARSGLFSFNHDTGEFGSVGPMVVSEDGKLVCSVDGTGILAPGWHGVANNNEAESEPDPPPRPMRPSRPPMTMNMCPDVDGPSFWAAAKTIGKCIAALSKAEGVLEAISAAIEGAVTARDRMIALKTAYEAGGISTAALRAGLDGIGAVKDTAKAEWKALTGAGSPLEKVAAGVACVGGLLELAATPCRAIGSSPECEDKYSLLVQIACDVIVRAADRFSVVQMIFEILNNIVDAAPFVVPCAALDLAKAVADKQLAKEAMQATSGLAGQGLRTNEVDGELVSALQAVVDDLDQQIGPADPTEVIAYFDEMMEAEANAGRAHHQYRGPSRNAFVLVEQNGQQQRLLADGSGHMRTFVAPSSRGAVSIVDRETLACGAHSFKSGNPGRPVDLPPIALGDCEGTDGDGDELTEEAEEIVGTSPANPDTDGDGTLDGAEVRAGTDPLDGIVARTGVLAAVSTSSLAIDVCSSGGLIGVASFDGVTTVFNTFEGMSPIRIARVRTPALWRIACGPNAVVVGGQDKLTVIEFVRDTLGASIRSFSIPGMIGPVALSGGEAYVAHAGGIWAVDLATGAVTIESTLNEVVDDLAVSHGLIYALGARLHVIDPVTMEPLYEESPPPSNAPGLGRRIFVGSREVFGLHNAGLTSFDLSDPRHPTFIAQSTTPTFGWRDVALNGSGLAIVPTGVNSTETTPHDLEIYNVRDPARLDRFVNTIPVPGHATAVCIERGLAYASFSQRVRGASGGLVVAGYTSADMAGRPPRISLSSSAGTNTIARATFAVTASVADDVEVRNVEFYRGDVLIFSDGSYPFEVEVIAPDATATFKARAFDTGGNGAWSEELVITSGPDRTPPTVLTVTMPRSAPRAIRAAFSEAVDFATLTDAEFVVVEAGADRMFDTSDDVATTGALAFSAGDRVVQMVFTEILDGNYRITLDADIADRAGNRLGTPYVATMCTAAACEMEGPLRLVSALSGVAPLDRCALTGVSFDASVVSFESQVSDLVLMDTNMQQDVFTVDYPSLGQERMNVTPMGVEADALSNQSALSQDGNFVVFASRAVSLGANGSFASAFVRDRAMNTLEMVSVDSMGNAANNTINSLVIGGDGRFVAFESSATNLDPLSSNGERMVYLRDRQMGTTTLVSVDSNGTPLPVQNRNPRVSTDGNRIAFRNVDTRLYLRDRALGTTRLIDLDEMGNQVLNSGNDYYLTANGRWFVYSDGNGSAIFSHDLDTGTVTREAMGMDLFFPSISEDGSRLLYSINGAELVLLERGSGTTRSLITTRVQNSRISGDGSTIIFEANVKVASKATYPYRLAIP